MYNIKIINLCPHTISLYDNNGKVIVSFLASGNVARCEEMTSPYYFLPGGGKIPVVNKSYGEVMDLPEPEEGTYYIVSMLIRSRLPMRVDLLSPGDAVRDWENKIIGCKNFVQN